MVSFQNNVSFIGFDLAGYVETNLFRGDELIKVTEIAKGGTIKPPYPLQVFPLSQLEQAFRMLGGGNSSGKIVVEVTKDGLVPVMIHLLIVLRFHTNVCGRLSWGHTPNLISTPRPPM